MSRQDKRGGFKNDHRRRKRVESNDEDLQPVAYNGDETTCEVLQMFGGFQTELDTRYDKHERLVKLGRDVTIESKRIIFLLHRILREENEGDTLEEAGRRLTELRERSFKAIAEELNHEDPYLFLRAYSPGLQEYIEAVTFYHYLENGRLLPLQELQKHFTFQCKNVLDKDESLVLTLNIPPSEYILGIADLTGELMRKCINSICAGNVNVPFTLRTFMREILEGFILIGGNGPRELKSKLNVMRQSMDKVENACYTVKVRRTELPEYKVADVLLINPNGDTREKEDEFSNDF